MGLVIERHFYRDLPPPPPLPVETPELHAIAQYVRQGRCALFVGAGLSAGAGLPTWDALMKRFIHRITRWAISEGVVPNEIMMVENDQFARDNPNSRAVRKELGERNYDELIAAIRRKSSVNSLPHVVAMALEIVGRESIERAELLRLRDQKRFPELAEFCKARLGSWQFEKQMRRALVPKRGLLPSHRHIVRTPFSCVVTTNFDTLLEQAYATYGRDGVPRAPTGAELTQLGTLLLDGSFFVLKAHGDALRPETMVFSSNDYRRLIHSTPAFQAVFSSILMTNAVLFVGYSLSDTNFRLLLDQQFTVFRGQVPPRYALLSGVGSAEEDILWQTARLQVLSYPTGEHQHLEHFLKALADATALPGAKPRRAAPTRPKARSHDERSPITLGAGIRDDYLLLELGRPTASQIGPEVWACRITDRDLENIGVLTRAVIKAHEMRHSAAPEIGAVGELFKRLLPAAFLRRVRALGTDSPLQVACKDGTHLLPWEWIPVGGRPLCLKNAIGRSPVSLTDTARGYRAVKGRGRALVIGDAGSGQPPELDPLPGAEREAAGILKQLCRHLPPRAITRLSRKTATRSRILRELSEGDYDIIHFAGHAWFTDRESYFWAWDEIMLGSELTPLLSRRPPALLVLSTHFTSFVPWGFNEDFRARLLGRSLSLQDLEAESSSGFAEVAMRCGVAAFVGYFGEPPDLDSADSMIAFYQALMSGHSVAAALLRARRQRYRRGRTSSMMLTATGFADLRIFG